MTAARRPQQLGFETGAELASWALASPQLWLMLDYDGTLAEFAPTPAHVEARPRVVSLLEKLASKPTIRLTVISGRRLPDIRALIPIPGILIAGSYGIELLLPDGQTVHRASHETIRPILDQLKPKWAELLDGREGFFLEDKAWTLALHGRRADPVQADLILEEARGIAELVVPAEGFRVVGGYKFLEIAPALADKGETVTYLLERLPLPDSRLVYIGDDDKDEEAFPVVQAHGGAAVRVLEPAARTTPTAADLLFQDPEETLAWLKQLL